MVEDEHTVKMALHYLEKAEEEANLFPQPSHGMLRIQEKSTLLKQKIERSIPSLRKKQ